MNAYNSFVFNLVNLRLTRLIVLLSGEDEAGTAWANGIAREWADELSDSSQDIYTLADGQSIDAAR